MWVVGGGYHGELWVGGWVLLLLLLFSSVLDGILVGVTRASGGFRFSFQPRLFSCGLYLLPS